MSIAYLWGASRCCLDDENSPASGGFKQVQHPYLSTPAMLSGTEWDPKRQNNYSTELTMSDRHVCPWWLAYTFDNPLRRLIHNPRKIFSKYVQKGMTVMDVGCGMGYFTLGLAGLVGDEGQVIGVDLQQEMLDITLKRARKKGLEHRIILNRAAPTSIGITKPVDFVLAFWMVHETTDPEKFFAEIATILKPTGKIIYTEPAFHVPEKQYQKILSASQKSGLTKSQDLNIAFSRAALLTY